MQQASDYIKSTHTRFFESFANQGERLGQLKAEILELDDNHNVRLEKLKKKQETLFNAKNVEKWENEDALRLPKAD